MDATAAPIASLTPISSWVGFEVGLIDNEIQKLAALYGEENLTIETSGLGVFLQSIKYRYYPIFMLILIPFLIYSQRDFGPMLIAERKTQVYQRIDGGDGKGPASKHIEGGKKKENQPLEDTPNMAWNMAIPIVMLVFFIFFLLVKTGEDGSGEQDFMDKIESSDSYSALLWGTMAATAVTLLFYLLQVVQYGQLILPTWSVLKAMFGKSTERATAKNDNATENVTTTEHEEAVSATSSEEVSLLASEKPRSLMTIYESVEAFLYGMGRIFPALIVLTLAWASGSIMTAVGADRLFSRWITEGVSPEAMPTISFLISIFMALATGTSWGTMTILFPLICVPTYQVSNGDATIFYATVAGILSGAVAGDHVSPISDTTVLSSLASDCQLLAHVSTQAPYAIIMMILSILFGTLPIGMEAWPNIVGIVLGVVAIALFVYGMCVPVLCKNGRFDIFTNLWLRIRKDSALHQLSDDTAKRYQEGPFETSLSLLDNNQSPDGDAASELAKAEPETNQSNDILDVLPRPALSEFSV